MSNRRLRNIHVITVRVDILQRFSRISGDFRPIYLLHFADFAMMGTRIRCPVHIKEIRCPFSRILHPNQKGHRRVGIMSCAAYPTTMEVIWEDTIRLNSNTRFLNNGGGWTMNAQNRSNTRSFLHPITFSFSRNAPSQDAPSGLQESCHVQILRVLHD